MTQKIKIGKEEFKVIDAKEYMAIQDCFIFKNKLGGGHGEAKFYVGQDNKETMDFFDDFSRKCIVLKSDFMKYLKDAKSEYNHPEQDYKNRKSLPNDWKKHLEMVAGMKDEVIYFLIYRVDIKPPRVYINSKDDVYSFIRAIALPNISYISALKLQSSKGEKFYYFRMFLDYFGEEDHPSVIRGEVKKIRGDKKINTEDKKQLIRARTGQGDYRNKLLEEIPSCQ